MSTASRTAEAEKTALVYQVALTQIGASVVAEALLLWRQEVPPTGGASASSSFLRKVVALIMRKRTKARALSRAYYRLYRALLTGYTIADSSDARTQVALNDLRSDFRHLAGPRAPGPSADDAVIPVEHIPGLDADAARQDREAEREAWVAVGNLGPANLEKKLQEIGTDEPASQVDQGRQKAHDEAGARQAAAARRIVDNAARGDTWSAIEGDHRAIGYVRVSTTGTPCGWCAMLISRGPVIKGGKVTYNLYRSKRTAETAVYGDGDKYHDNCNCRALPVYSLEHYQTSPAFAQNREYAEMWPKASRDLNGAYSLTAWRRYIRTTNRARVAHPTNARATQEA